MKAEQYFLLVSKKIEKYVSYESEALLVAFTSLKV
jgi:hypothetical protein